MQEFLRQKIKSRLPILIFSGLAFFVWSFYFTLPDGRLHLKFYNVGQGDSIFIETPAGYQVLIDGGPDNKVLGFLGRDLGLFDKSLDMIVLTHPQLDHFGGLIEVVKRYHIGAVIVNGDENNTAEFKEWQAVLDEKGIRVINAKIGDIISLPDGVNLRVINSGRTSNDLNTGSIVLEVSYLSFDALLTGDADQKNQPYKTSKDSFEVFKVPHHGSKTAIKKDYISKLSPQISVISVGKNRYGHPSEEIISYLKNNRSKVYRTDQDGLIEIVSNGQSWYTRTQR